MDEPTNAPAPRSGCLPKLLIILFAACLVAGFSVVFGVKFLRPLLISLKPFSDKPREIQLWVKEAALSYVSLPSEVSFAAAYRKVFGQKELEMFVATSGDEGVRLPNDHRLAFNLNLYTRPAYFFLVRKETPSDIEPEFKQVVEKIQNQGPTSLIQDRIWVGENEMPAFMGETTAGEKNYRSLVIKFAENGLFFTVSPAVEVSSAPLQEILSSALKVKPDAVSFSPPETPEMRLARIIVTGGDPTNRKMAVTNLATLEGPHGEAVAFLGVSLSSGTQADVKTDIVAALGLLAKKNPGAIPPLVTALDDKSVRLEAMEALRSLGSAAGSAVGKLKRIAANKKEPNAVQNAAMKTLVQIEGRPVTVTKKGKKKATPKMTR